MTNLPTLFEDSDQSALPTTKQAGGKPWRDPSTGAIVTGDFGLTLQSETAGIVSRTAAAGGSLDALTVFALDRFVVRMKAASIWAKLDEVWPHVGGSLISAFQKLKYYNTAAYTNNGLTSGAFTQRTGLSATTSGHYIATGYNPATAGRTANDITICANLLGAPTYDTSGFPIGSSNAYGGECPLLLSGRFMGVAGGTLCDIGVNANYPKAMGASYRAGGVSAFAQNGMPSIQLAASVSSNNINSEINLFRVMRNATFYYNNQPLGMVCLGSGLTRAELTELQNAMIDFETDIGRIGYADYRSSLAILGDSVTSGQGATSHAT